MFSFSLRALLLVLCSAFVLSRPNVLIWMSDDMLFYQDERPAFPPGETAHGVPGVNLPNVDAVQSEGLTFTRGYSSSAMCTPARFSVLTGRYASRGVRNAAGNTHADGVLEVTVPSVSIERNGHETTNLQTIFRSEGYRTYQAGKWHLSASTDATAPYADQQTAVQDTGFDRADGIYMGNINDPIPYSHNMEWVTSVARDFITEAVNMGKPFFMYFCPTIPHGPDAEYAMFEHNLTTTPAGQIEFTNSGMPSRDDVLTRAQAYFQNSGNRRSSVAAALWTDDSLGSLVSHLTNHDILNNTVLVVLMDHGMISKGALYEGGTRILHTIRYPELFEQGASTDLLVNQIDLGPTLLAITGLNTTYEMDGEPWWTPDGGLVDSNTDRVFFTQGDFDRAVETPALKYIEVRSPTTRAAYPYAVNFTQLYDLRVDETEQNNLAYNPNYASLLADMQDLLACHHDSTKSDATGTFFCRNLVAPTPNDSLSSSPSLTPSATVAPSATPTPSPSATPPTPAGDDCPAAAIETSVLISAGITVDNSNSFCVV